MTPWTEWLETTRGRAAVLALGSVVLVLRAWPSLGTVVDDAYISARYARNLAEGNGLVYNVVGPPVEGISNLAWTWLMALAHLTAIPPMWLMVRLGVGFAVLALPAALLLTDRLAGRRTAWSCLPVLGMACSPHLAISASNGLETSMFAAAVLWACWATLAAEGRRRTWAALAVGGLVLVRPEGLAVTAVLAALDMWRRRERIGRADTWLFAIAAAVVLVPLVFWRWETYGALVPNTVAAKGGGSSLSTLLPINARTLTRASGAYWPAMAALLPIGWAIGDWRSPARAAVAALVVGLTATALSVYMWMPADRLLVPGLGLLFALGASAGPALSRGRGAWALVLIVVGLLGLEAGMTQRNRRRDLAFHPRPALWRVADQIGQQLPAGSTVYVFDAGLFAYGLGSHVTVAEAHPRALTRKHPGGAKSDFERYTPPNPEVIVLTTTNGRRRASTDEAAWRRRTAPYHYLGRVAMHPQRVYDVFTRADLDLPPLPAEWLLPGSGTRDGAIDRLAPRDGE